MYNNNKIYVIECKIKITRASLARVRALTYCKMSTAQLSSVLYMLAHVNCQISSVVRNDNDGKINYMRLIQFHYQTVCHLAFFPSLVTRTCANQLTLIYVRLRMVTI